MLPHSNYKVRPYLGRGACHCTGAGNVKQNTTWEDIVSKQLPGGMEEEDWDKEDSQPAVGSQFEDTPVAAEVSKEEIMEESVTGEPPIKHEDEATVGPGSQDVVQIHMGEDDL